MPTKPTPVTELSYEQARDELITVVARLEAGGETLEGSLALWERGEALAARCLEWLDGARARLDATDPNARPALTRGTPSAARDGGGAIGPEDDALGSDVGLDGGLDEDLDSDDPLEDEG